MANNATWILDHEPHDTLAIWGHNPHVRRGTVEGWWGNARTMGNHLDETYGDDYFALGFDFADGSFQAKVEQDSGNYELEECQLGEPRDGSISEILSRVDEPLYFLDIKECVREEVLRPIFSEEQEIHTVGAVYYGQNSDRHYETVVAGEAYNGLIFIMETTQAESIKGG